MSEKQFASGMRASRREGTPEFVKASLGIKVEEFIEWLRGVQNGSEWVNIDIKVGKSGKWYAELNTYNRAETARSWESEPKTSIDAQTGQRIAPPAYNQPKPASYEYPTEEINPADIPF